MRIFLASLLVMLSATASYAGSCNHSWQQASDGSRCGGRAADQRPGG